jgi:L-lactate dehydrogenase complex protein LldG
MNSSAESRQQILDSIRAATQTVAQDSATLADAYAVLPRAYIHRGQLSTEALLALMVERLREYGAEVVECSPGELTATIAAQLTASGKHIFTAPAGLPAAWFIPGFDWKVDYNLTTQEIEGTEGVVTSSSAGIADSGTIALHHSPTEGRRVLSLLPDWHLCVLYASQVVETLPEYFSRIPQPPRLATWISGPSATADIEMTRIKGVHGPRFLHVVLVRDERKPETVLERSRQANNL